MSAGFIENSQYTGVAGNSKLGTELNVTGLGTNWQTNESIWRNIAAGSFADQNVLVNYTIPEDGLYKLYHCGYVAWNSITSGGKFEIAINCKNVSLTYSGTTDTPIPGFMQIDTVTVPLKKGSVLTCHMKIYAGTAQAATAYRSFFKVTKLEEELV